MNISTQPSSVSSDVGPMIVARYLWEDSLQILELWGNPEDDPTGTAGKTIWETRESSAK